MFNIREDVMGRMSNRAWVGTAGRRSSRRTRERARVLAVEALETRALLSTIAATPVKDINTVDSYPAELTPAGTNLFYTVDGSTAGGVELAVTTGGGGT